VTTPNVAVNGNAGGVDKPVSACEAILGEALTTGVDVPLVMHIIPGTVVPAHIRPT